MNDTASNTESTQVICPATRDAGIRLLIIAAMMLGFAGYCFSDWGDPKYDAPEVWDLKHINEIGGHLLTYYGPLLFLPPGLVMAFLGLRAMKRKLIADATGIGYEGKAKTAWSDVKGIDASQLADKQILSLKLAGDEEIKLDGYDLQNFKELVAFVETKVPVAVPPASDE